MIEETNKVLKIEVLDMTGKPLVSDEQVRANIEMVLKDISDNIGERLSRTAKTTKKKEKAESWERMDRALLAKEINNLVHQQKLFYAIRNTVLTKEPV